MYKFILASASPRRRELMPLIVRDFSVCTADCSEHTDFLSPQSAVIDIARKKCMAAFESIIAAGNYSEDSSLVIISADTVVSVAGDILGKPKDYTDAHHMLSRLSGATHSVYTGVCVFYSGEYSCFAERTDVTFREVRSEEIHSYIGSGEPMDKAGAYGAQGLGARFIKSINGDFFNVMGLPVCALYSFLHDLLPDFSD